MGDMADYAIEQGMDMLAAHQGGHCFEDCRCCDEEDELRAAAEAAEKAGK